MVILASLMTHVLAFYTQFHISISLHVGIRQRTQNREKVIDACTQLTTKILSAQEECNCSDLDLDDVTKIGVKYPAEAYLGVSSRRQPPAEQAPSCEAADDEMAYLPIEGTYLCSSKSTYINVFHTEQYVILGIYVSG
ncbi:hypothetical protein GGS24DRAFT_483684 [Hypoxylon argillaceum]|nr:hypothetical protein GGS24DRAFT_483684 [Hypoxylon argillaceum]